MKSIIFSILLFTIGCAHQPFTQSDKILLGTSLTLQAIDWQQTKEIARNPDFYEKWNFVLDEHPSQNEIDLYFLTTAFASVATIYYLPPKYRNLFFGCWIGIEGDCVVHNYQIGVRF